MFVLRRLLALLPLSFAIAGSAQTTVKVFTSMDGAFGFKYSPILVDCTKPVQTRPTSSGVPKVFVGSPPALSIPDSCMSQGGMCNDGGQGRTLACFAYPKDKFRDKPTFVAAANLAPSECARTADSSARVLPGSYANRIGHFCVINHSHSNFHLQPAESGPVFFLFWEFYG